MYKAIQDKIIRYKIQIKRDLFNLKKPYWVGLIFIILILLQIIQSLLKPEIHSHVDSVDTFVPAGYVLVPLTLVNIESIDSMISEKTLVDVYNIGDENENSKSKKLIASHLPLIRSTLDPSQVAVLVEEQDQSTIQALTAPVFAVVKNPNSKKTINIKQPSNQNSTKSNVKRVIYGDSL